MPTTQTGWRSGSRRWCNIKTVLSCHRRDQRKESGWEDLLSRLNRSSRFSSRESDIFRTSSLCSSSCLFFYTRSLLIFLSSPKKGLFGTRREQAMVTRRWCSFCSPYLLFQSKESIEERRRMWSLWMMMSLSFPANVSMAALMTNRWWVEKRRQRVSDYFTPDIMEVEVFSVAAAAYFIAQHICHHIYLSTAGKGAESEKRAPPVVPRTCLCLQDLASVVHIHPDCISCHHVHETAENPTRLESEEPLNEMTMLGWSIGTS